MPEADKFPRPLEYIDVVRRTNTTSDVLLESRIADYWDHARYMCSGMWLTKIQATSRPDSVSPQIWSRMSKAALRKEKQHWAIEKPKLD